MGSVFADLPVLLSDRVVRLAGLVLSLACGSHLYSSFCRWRTTIMFCGLLTSQHGLYPHVCRDSCYFLLITVQDEGGQCHVFASARFVEAAFYICHNLVPLRHMSARTHCSSTHARVRTCVTNSTRGEVFMHAPKEATQQ